jgi:glycine betaine/proline transport system permease protein
MTAITPSDVAGRELPTWRPNRWQLVGGIVVIWVGLYLVLEGHGVLADGQPSTAVQDKFTNWRDWADANRNTSPLFVYGFNYVRVALETFYPWISNTLTNIGWTGVTAVFGAVALIFANWKIALLAVLGVLSFGVLGLWQESMDTLSLTLAAVSLSVAFGLALGVWAGMSSRFNAFVTPVLDFMQILPSFAYLPLITLFFQIGPASSIIATMIYALPPVIRLTAAGIREVSTTTVEAATALGSTRGQRLRQVQLPMAKKTIVLGVNQTIMAALSMVTIAALIGAPGLGQTVLNAVSKLNVGVAFNAGLAIVIMAIVLDRMTTAASERTEKVRRAGGLASALRRRIVVAGALVVAAVAIFEGRTFLWANQFPDSLVHPVSAPVNTASNWVETNLYTLTSWIFNSATLYVINPLSNLLEQSPWWLVIIAVAAISLVLAGARVAAVSVFCLAAIIGLGLWNSAMHTLASVLIGAAIVMVIGTVVGVWAGRNSHFETVLRPLLDAGQVMPAFVFLPPCLALFGVGAFTGIVAAVVYAMPAVIKVVIEGIRGVSPTTIEAAESSGSSAWQVIRKVQLPMARPQLLLAFNQGVIYVLAMVVVGGLVGSQGLGLAVITGFAQSQLAGMGLAAGIAIVLLGVMLDRITQGAGRDRRTSGAS